MQSLATKREAVIREWFERTIDAYPDQPAGFLLDEKDPFRNPVGHTLREGLAVLFDGLLSRRDESRTSAALDSIVRLRAVQNYTPSQAVSFLFLLKKIVRDLPVEADLAALDNRIDETALLAFDLYVKCREKICEIKAEEGRRRVFLLEQAYLKRGGTL
jgi:hypothetical protein